MDDSNCHLKLVAHNKFQLAIAGPRLLWSSAVQVDTEIAGLLKTCAAISFGQESHSFLS